MTTHEERLARARISLEGLSVADAFGGFFEFWRFQLRYHFIKNRQLPDGTWNFTDDTNMALSIYENLRLYRKIEQDELAISYAEHFEEPRAYGTGAIRLLEKIRNEGDWRELSKSMFYDEGSFGNGGAMRVAPLGAYFSDDINAVIENAKLSAEITHAHPEGIAGAIAVAVAAAIAFKYRNKPKPTLVEFINQILPHVPESEVRENCTNARDIPEDMPISDVALKLGNGRHIAAMDTVPISLWSAVKWMDNFEEAFWQTASIGGDVDTTCAIVGGIVACYVGQEGIPKNWLEHREKLPNWALEDV
jgi:ADP-ribosylglycohydrolase